ncbi:hypothetical protein GCM10010448_58780 [Streptomyces glomeratus]|uniref:Secreted protein n=1 Tax=Streptomyces glomeratus TaxID=284452 RepID=A0ABP6M198_9ACTN
MSKIHSCWVLLGSRSALIAGIAKYRTETSIETSSSGSIRTPRAVHSRRPARVAEVEALLVEFVMTGTVRAS